MSNSTTRQIKLGNTVRDIVTGFQGIATSRVEYINGCVQICIKPKSEEGKMPEGHFVDIEQVEFVDDGIVIKQKTTGGVMPDTPRAR